MADSPLPPNPNPNTLPPLTSTRPSPALRPPIRLTSEFDSESAVFLHKISCKVFDGLAKLKVSFQNDRKGEIAAPQLGFLTKHLSVFYDVESRNALLKGSFDVAKFLHFRATHDIKTGQLGEPDYVHIGFSTKLLSVSFSSEKTNSVVSSVHFGSIFKFKYHHRKEQQGEVAVVASLSDPLYKLELASSVPAVGLPRATVHFPLGEISMEETKNEEADKVLSINGILKGHALNGVCTASYRDNDLNLRYCFKDEEITFIPRISLPSNALSFAFKRHFGRSDKLSYLYHFDSNEWSAVYKRLIAKDFKLKAGYDSNVRLGWASLWIGDEDGKAKTAPMKMKVQFMLQVPQDNVKSSVVMFQVKKRWDF